MGQVRIIGGTHRSRILKFKDGIKGLRPTPDAVRQRLFNWLEQDLTGKKCLDLFAGSGALGFEAVSRNAKSVVLVETDKVALKDLVNNKALLKADNSTIISLPALKYLESTNEVFDVIFIDPPYDSDLLIQTLRLIQKRANDRPILSANGLIYIEYNKKPDLSGFQIIKESKPGFVNYALLELLHTGKIMEPKINFKEYEVVDELDEEEKLIWDELQQGKYHSIKTSE